MWCDFLSSPESLYVLNDTPQGWKSADAQKQMKIEEYQYDSHDKYWGSNRGTISSTK
jgi:phosphatidylserine decarboxylase